MKKNAKDVAWAANYVHQLPLLIEYSRTSWHKMSEGKVARDFPFYKSQRIEGNQIIITFDSVGSGLMKGKEGPLDSFAIAGDDRNFVWAPDAQSSWGNLRF